LLVLGQELTVLRTGGDDKESCCCLHGLWPRLNAREAAHRMRVGPAPGARRSPAAGPMSLIRLCRLSR
jgi:hypothetical protein